MHFWLYYTAHCSGTGGGGWSHHKVLCTWQLLGVGCNRAMVGTSTCSKMYVGQTSKSLLNRFGHHRFAAKKKRNSMWPIYHHFSSRGHSFETRVKILPLKHCPSNQLLSREIHWIRALNTVLPFGLNSQYSTTQASLTNMSI